MGQDIAAGRIERQLGLKLRCSPAGTGTCVEVIEPPTALMPEAWGPPALIPEVWGPDSFKERRACGGKILKGDILMTVGQIFVNRMPLDELQDLLLGPPGVSRPQALEPSVSTVMICVMLSFRDNGLHIGGTGRITRPSV